MLMADVSEDGIRLARVPEFAGVVKGGGGAVISSKVEEGIG